MTRDQALAAADRAASAVWNRKGSWLEPHLSLGMTHPLDMMALLLDREPVTGEVLYRAVAGPEYPERPWEMLKPAARASFETFRATYLALMVLVRADAEAARERSVARRVPAPYTDRVGDDDGDVAPGWGDRVVMR